jgi:predicted lipoprotein with Yx(FWY)xxD motif
MRLSAMHSPKRSLLGLVLPALAAVALVSPAGASASHTKLVAKKMANATLGKTVLTTTRGHTLYSLSVEKHGKFTCTGFCTTLWHPLVVPAGVKPKGPVKLGTVKRPDGRIQVTYKGLPLYSFGKDKKVGDAKGEGVRDVGTWHAATVASTASQPQPQPPPENPYPY